MKNNYDKQIGVLDWLIFCSIFFLIIMVYVPLSVWEEEDYYKQLRRERMRNIADAQEFFFELTGNYTEDHIELFGLVIIGPNIKILAILQNLQKVKNTYQVLYS